MLYLMICNLIDLQSDNVLGKVFAVQPWLILCFIYVLLLARFLQPSQV